MTLSRFRLFNYLHSIIIAAATTIVCVATATYIRTSAIEFQGSKQWKDKWYSGYIAFATATVLAYILINIFEPRISHLKKAGEWRWNAVSFRIIPIWACISLGVAYAIIIDTTSDGRFSIEYLYEWIYFVITPAAFAAILSQPSYEAATSGLQSSLNAINQDLLMPRNTMHQNNLHDESSQTPNIEHDYQGEENSATRTCTKKHIEQESISYNTHDNLAEPISFPDYHKVNPKFTTWWNQYGTWLSSDEPTTTDFLHTGFESSAARILRLLQDSNDIRAIGLRGPFGSGKSSVIRLAQIKAQEQTGEPLVTFCVFSCWGIEDPDKSISDLIDSCISAVAPIVDVFSVKTLGSKYRDSVSKGDSLVDRISSFIWGESKFRDMFEKLNKILELAKIRLVIVVEDLDRNASDRFDPQRILSFLFQLRNFSAIKLIIASDLLSLPTLRIDFLKLCDHIEYMHRPDYNTIEFCHNLELMCLNDLRLNSIAKVKLDASSALMARSKSNESLFSSPRDAISALLNNPRRLKAVTRDTLKLWTTLAGEVSWSDLFITCILKVSSDTVYDLMDKERDSFLGDISLRIRSDSERSDNLEVIKNIWHQAFINASSDPEHILSLICYMFPYTDFIQIKTSPRVRRPDRLRPQSININRYWNRVKLCRLSEGETSDGTIVNDYDNYLLTGNLDTIISRLRDESELDYQLGWASLIEYFSALEYRSNDKGDIRSLIIGLYKFYSKSNDIDDFVSYPILETTLEFALSQTQSPEEITTLLERLVEIGAHSSLLLVTQTCNSFRRLKSGLYFPLLYDKVVETLRKTLQTPEDLAKILPFLPNSQTLTSLIAPNESNLIDSYLSDWHWLLDILSKLVLDANLDACQLVGVTLNARQLHFGVDIDDKIAKHLFRSDADSVIKTLKQHFEKLPFLL